MRHKYRYLNLYHLQSPYFYSPLREALLKGQKRAPADQWPNIIKSLRNRGVKEAEINDSGILEELKGKKGRLTREELVELMRINQNLVKEIDLSTPKYKRYSYAQYGADYKETFYVLATENDYLMDQILDIDFEIEDLDFYPERLIENPLYAQELYKQKQELTAKLNELNKADSISVSHYHGTKDPETGEEIKSLLFHTRSSIQEDGKTFFVEEVQSDWAQRGRQLNWRDIEKAPWITSTDLWVGMAFRRLMQRAANDPKIERFAWVTGDYRNGGYFICDDGLNDFYIKVVGRLVNRALSGTGEKAEFAKVRFGHNEFELPTFNMTDKVREKLKQPQPIYSRDAMRRTLSAQARQALEPAMHEAIKSAKYMLGNSASIKLLAAMADPKGDPVAGQFFGHCIEVSLSGNNPARALAHECWHYAYEHLLNNKERQVADTAFRNPKLLERLTLAMQANGFTQAAINQCADPKEAVAHAYSLWAEGKLELKAAPKELNSAFNKTKSAFSALHQEVDAAYSYEETNTEHQLLELFEQLRQGEMAERLNYQSRQSFHF